jgi:2-phosphosulfolactate phosphatase
MVKSISVAFLPALLNSLPTSLPLQDSGSVVIDTLRFTTTASVALSRGAASLMVAATIEQARKLQAENPGSLLCGERHCYPIPGFQLGNSPLEYTRQTVSGRTLIFSTTNGTLAVQATQSMQRCLLAALVNRHRVAHAIIDSDIESWWIVCAGTDGQVAGEDVLAAGAVIHACQQPTVDAITLGNDIAQIALQLWRDSQQLWFSGHHQPQTALQSFVGAVNLASSGYGPDIAFAAGLDTIQDVPHRVASNRFVSLGH